MTPAPCRPTSGSWTCPGLWLTVAALFGYFRGILRDKTAYLLTALVAVAYVLSYILLQMQTYALLAGTLLLFVLLVGIMYLTTNLNKRAEA